MSFTSENCSGQNKNKFIATNIAVQQLNVKNTHYFLGKGHIQNENDRVHASIKLKARKRTGELFTPEHISISHALKCKLIKL